MGMKINYHRSSYLSETAVIIPIQGGDVKRVKLNTLQGILSAA